MEVRVRSDLGRAFSILELMIAVSIIGVAALLARPAIVRATAQARANALMNDLRVFAAAFSQYAHTQGGFPASYTTAGGFPVAMSGAIQETQWKRRTPIGGHYAFLKDTRVGGVRYRALLRVSGSGAARIAFTAAQLLELDRKFDNGNAGTGQLFTRGAALTTYSVIDP